MAGNNSNTSSSLSSSSLSSSPSSSSSFTSDGVEGGMGIIRSILPQYDADLFASIREKATYLPPERNAETVIGIICTACVIALLHLIFLFLCKRRSATSTALAKESDEDRKRRSLSDWKASYQLTNLLVNLSLGCLGVYYHLAVVLPARPHESPADRIAGHEDLLLFAILQIGYQSWALPVGLFVVGESAPMLVHHAAVLCVASTSAFLTCGFRYYTPYFYGLIEISSVPLAVMNWFKDRPARIEAAPRLYPAVRTAFGVAFLLVRVVLWTPFFYDFFGLAAMLLYATEDVTARVVLSVFNASSLLLTFLQYHWAILVVSGLYKGPKKNKAMKKLD